MEGRGRSHPAAPNPAPRAAAQAAARALLENTDLSAREIVERSLNIAADICIYTNHNLRIEELDVEPKE